MRRFYSLVLLAACTRPHSVATRVPAGGERVVRVYVPPGPAPADGYPLVVMLHGAKTTAWRTERNTGWSQLAAREGFIVAYPQGVNRSWNDGRGGAVPATAANSNDIAWLDQVFDHLLAQYPVDAQKVVLAGASNGGMLGWRWVCERKGRISVFAPVLAGLPEPLAADCAPTPVGTLVIQATGDPLVPVDGGDVGRDRGRVISTTAAVETVATANACTGAEPVSAWDSVPTDGQSATRTAWRCEGPPLHRIDLLGAGHLWPGGRQVLPSKTVGRVSADLDATHAIWTFATETVWSPTSPRKRSDVQHP